VFDLDEALTIGASRGTPLAGVSEQIFKLIEHHVGHGNRPEVAPALDVGCLADGTALVLGIVYRAISVCIAARRADHRQARTRVFPAHFGYAGGALPKCRRKRGRGKVHGQPWRTQPRES
jgi:hypothetical protein